MQKKAETVNEIQFSDIFDLKEIQRIQDFFADATGVASIIIRPDGTPITNPSNFCRLCNEIIRKTDIGLTNCIKSDAEIGRPNPSGPVIQPCLSGCLWDAGVSIIVGGKHWLISIFESCSFVKYMFFMDLVLLIVTSFLHKSKKIFFSKTRF
ncbi:MAG: PocR ligand-binding domain-containing protein [Bacteroidales bacterium]